MVMPIFAFTVDIARGGRELNWCSGDRTQLKLFRRACEASPYFTKPILRPRISNRAKTRICVETGEKFVREFNN